MFDLDISEFFDRLARMPVYWHHDSSPALREAVEAYLSNKPLSKAQILSIKLYLEQFIAATSWEITDEVIDLQYSVEKIATVKDIDDWVESAIAVGIDPL